MAGGAISREAGFIEWSLGGGGWVGVRGGGGLRWLWWVDAVNRNRRIRITREHPLLPSLLRELKEAHDRGDPLNQNLTNAVARKELLLCA